MSVGEELLEEMHRRRRAGDPRITPEGRQILARLVDGDLVEEFQAALDAARWQRRLEPLNKRLAGGCHLTRRIPDAVERAGFVIERLDTFYFGGEPKPIAYTFEGRALRD